MNRFANLSWNIDLCQMWLISLLFLPLSSALLTKPYPSGIQDKIVREDDLKSECSICYEDRYQDSTIPEDILSCAGPVLFVGALKGQFWWFWQSKIVHLGAFALASEVHQITALNTPHLSNGVYWYFTPRRSFGFLPDDTLIQNPSWDIGATNPYIRLSWPLDGWGGYSGGGYADMFFTSTKIIYNCPNNLYG